MRKGLRMIRCSGCCKPIWRNDIEGWCHDCRKFYTLLAEVSPVVERFFFDEGKGV